MDILIKGMEMRDHPQSITINPDGSVVKDTFGLHRPMDEWKAIALPEHHGRLIVADALLEKLEKIVLPDDLTYTVAHGILKQIVEDAETIVEATE